MTELGSIDMCRPGWHHELWLIDSHSLLIGPGLWTMSIVLSVKLIHLHNILSDEHYKFETVSYYPNLNSIVDHVLVLLSSYIVLVASKNCHLEKHRTNDIWHQRPLQPLRGRERIVHRIHKVHVHMYLHYRGISARLCYLVRIGIGLFLQCKCLRISPLHICYNLCIACKHCRVCPRVVQIQDHSLVDLQARDSCIHMSSISYRRSLHCNIPSWILAEYIFDLVRFLSLEMILVSEQFLHLTTSENWPEFLRTTSFTSI